MWSDQKVEIMIGKILRAGVILSASTVLLGGVIYLFRHGSSFANYSAFQGEPPELRSVAGIVHSALTNHGRGTIQLGLLLLIATPVVRVAFSIVAFAMERDWMYVAFTVVVLAVLLYSLIG